MIISLGMVGVFRSLESDGTAWRGTGTVPEKSATKKRIGEVRHRSYVPRPLLPHCAYRDVPEVFCVLGEILERVERRALDQPIITILKWSLLFFIVIFYTEERQMIKLDPFLPIYDSRQSLAQRRERDFKAKARCIEELRNTELINKKLTMHKRAVFPELQANNSKKTYNHLLSIHKSSQISPHKRYQPLPFSDKQTKVLYNQAEIFASGLQRICSRKDLNEEIEKHRIIGKSFSQSKKMVHLQQLSIQPIQLIGKHEKIYKVMTEESAASTSSRKIYQRLNSFKDKNQIVSIHSSQQIPEKQTLKSYKHSSFVLKYKAAQLHHEEKSQLTSIKNSRNQNLTSQLIENIKVKNYTNFFALNPQFQK